MIKIFIGPTLNQVIEDINNYAASTAQNIVQFQYQWIGYSYEFIVAFSSKAINTAGL